MTKVNSIGNCRRPVWYKGSPVFAVHLLFTGFTRLLAGKPSNTAFQCVLTLHAWILCSLFEVCLLVSPLPRRTARGQNVLWKWILLRYLRAKNWPYILYLMQNTKRCCWILEWLYLQLNTYTFLFHCINSALVQMNFYLCHTNSNIGSEKKRIVRHI